ncbi:hypothetical protein AXG93_411s1110 [Marchantia polymorpha subsp. ruderalis]|uniref:Uncharacterized protein n=1 Tax=Marchantia polymorpha subsp. ruderalis TaxID=1480154 RepID=A0A176VIF2_MARPO|nr:hypothetical protein AXG93_411s1110 [Marchantia polymorpha subsp. ruderalis]
MSLNDDENTRPQYDTGIVEWMEKTRKREKKKKPGLRRGDGGGGSKPQWLDCCGVQWRERESVVVLPETRPALPSSLPRMGPSVSHSAAAAAAEAAAGGSAAFPDLAWWHSCSRRLRSARLDRRAEQSSVLGRAAEL